MSSNATAIEVKSLGKCYQIYARPQDRLKQSIYPRIQTLVGRPASRYFQPFWALQDVSFEIQQGETVGIIGRNGSGKSTLLQLICGTLTPTNGIVQTRGRVAALLELGSGFNPEFTGRENIYLNGSVLGLERSEIDSRFDDIAAFADIGEFIEQPVKMYSSGMYIRLAFAINIMSQPDIMIVDEALAVGDMNFQAKCITALKRRQDAGTTVLFVSHDINTVKSLCSRAVYLERGQLKNIGSAAAIAEQYLRAVREDISTEYQQTRQTSPGLAAKTDQAPESAAPAPGIALHRLDDFTRRVAQFRYGTGEARVLYVDLHTMSGETITEVQFNQQVKIIIYLESYQEKRLSVNFNILDDKKNLITGANFLLMDQPLLDTQPGEQYRVEYTVHLPLQDGIYAVQVGLAEPMVSDRAASFVDYVDDAVVFSMARWEKAKLWSKVFMFPKLAIEKISEE